PAYCHLPSFPTRRSSDLGTKTGATRQFRKREEITTASARLISAEPRFQLRKLWFQIVCASRPRLVASQSCLANFAQAAELFSHLDRKSTRLNSSHQIISY